MFVVKLPQLNEITITTRNIAVVISIPIVPAISTEEAALTPFNMSKLINHRMILPPMIDQILFPPVNLPGKKKSNVAMSKTE